jgi:uncharacterized protein YfaA (DUF2138 family)
MSEKKGDLLNQLAIISDLLEKVTITTKNTTAFFEVDEKEFDKIINYLNKRYEGMVEDDGGGTFSILLGDINFVFSKNSV